MLGFIPPLTQKQICIVGLVGFKLFDVKQNGMIEFGSFVRFLNVFHPNADLEDKIQCKPLHILFKVSIVYNAIL
jgi:hypothetical protein